MLIADDNEINRKILIKMLGGEGCVVDTVSGGADAIQALKKAVLEGKPYHVALLDMQMPGMDGEHTTIIIKNTPAIKDTAIIIITSLGSRGDVEHLRELGCEGYLAKPIKQTFLLDAMAAILSARAEGKRRQILPVATRYTILDRKFRNLEILVAEDNQINQKLIVAMLKKGGYGRVEVADNGRAAIEAVGKSDFDIIFMDVQMPEIDGFAATKIVRELDTDKRHTVIVAMTAHAMKGDRERCMEAGMDDYLPKPIDPHELFKVIEKWAGARPDKSESPPEEGKEDTVIIDSTNTSSVDIPSAMERFDHDAAFFRTMLEEFLSYVPGQIRSLEDAVGSGDVAAVEMLGHGIKGAALMLSAGKLSSDALKIEIKGREKDLTGIQELVNDLKSEISNLAAFAKTFVSGTI